MSILLQDKIAAGITNVLVVFWRGWMLMLAVGIAHAEWVPGLPTIGYWWSCLLVWLLMGIGNQYHAREMAMDREGRENAKRTKALGRALSDVLGGRR